MSHQSAADPLVTQALDLLRQGQVSQASLLARQAVVLDPDLARAWACQGTVALVMGDAQTAFDALGKAVGLNDLLAEAHLNRAAAALALGRLHDCWQAVSAALAVVPDMAVGPVVAGLGQACRASFQAGNDQDGALLAGLLSGLGQHADAIATAQQLVYRSGMDAGGWALLGDCLLRAGHYADALKAASEAESRAPDDPAHAINQAGIEMAAGNRRDALILARRAVELHPQSCRAYFLLGVLLCEDGQQPLAARQFLAAAQAPDATAIAQGRAWYELAQAVDWDGCQTVQGGLEHFAGGDAANPFHLLIAPVGPARQLENARQFCRQTWPSRRPLAQPAQPRSRLKVGYLSPDYRDHPTTHLISDLFRHHCRDRFAIHLYGLGPQDGGACGQAVQALADGCTWLTGLSDHQAARRIAADQIDILVDLAGHTKDNGLGILSFRPAPVQMHYLGFPGTTGADFVDYLVADPWTVPPGCQQHYAESIMRMPLTYQINSVRPDPGPGGRAAWGLPDDGVVFCSFNHVRKVSRAMFAVWADILHRVPGSVLWLLVEEQAHKTALGAYAQHCGLDPARLIFAPRLERTRHLARLAAADLHLDTLPYNAHTTATDALWSGCPLVTLPGDTFASRVSAGILAAVGLHDCIAHDAADLVAKVVGLAQDPVALADLKVRTLATRSSPVFDPAYFTDRFEWGLDHIWRHALSGQRPIGVDIPAH